MSFLTINNISKSFSAKKAITDLSLEVSSGVIYGIIGPNGAGKTTTIRMIMNITQPDTGEILIDGKLPDRHFKNRVGYLPEERGLYKKMTLQEIILYLAELKGCKASSIKGEIDTWLEKVDLLPYKLRKVEELSKGMQQKLQFITTIIHKPDLIILDELFSGLDPLNMELMKNILLDLKRQGTTILFSTHVMEQAEKLCDHICMISNGCKVIDGRLAEVKSKFGNDTIQINIEGDGQFIRQIRGVDKMTEFNNYIELRPTPDADTNYILKSITDKVSVKRFDIVEPSLYDIFINLADGDESDLQSGEGRIV